MDEITKLRIAMRNAEDYLKGENVEIKGTEKIIGGLETAIKGIKAKMTGAKVDCFAYRSNNSCGVLREMICKKKSCPFYKTRSEYEQQRMD